MGFPLTGEEREFVEAKIIEAAGKIERAHAEIGKQVWGQDKVIANTLACMIAGGNLLVEGVPGLAKTLMVSQIANVMGLDWRRIQFTPDLMPSDITGSELLEEDEHGKKYYRLMKGPLFTQFVLADEINRTPPKTQSALLEAMQEKRVTIAGQTYDLQKPFFVMATENPLENDGTYPLPEAQLDRFLMKLYVDYPDEKAERRVMIQTTGMKPDALKALFDRHAAGENLTIPQEKDKVVLAQPVLGQNDLILMQALARRLPLSEDVVDATMKLVRRARPSDAKALDDVKRYVSWGPGPRAVQAFAQVAKARAVMRGDLAPNVDDVREIAESVLGHRMALSFTARADNQDFRTIVSKLKLGL